MTDSDEITPLRRSALIRRRRFGLGAAGRLVPNERLDDGRRVDDVLAGRYAILTTTAPTSGDRPAADGRGGAVETVRLGADLYRWLRQGGATAALIRPDGTVQQTGRDPAPLSAALPRTHILVSPAAPCTPAVGTINPTRTRDA
ncbi:hypothetical protein [Nocardia sp. NRRL WC-3656]|uniref:aromatic-ring hydroxylase C-terminal domain-containing protein n=1 Tax=Nocardia sp. NRRL WC-3656 TaxID=1463824 RepID=UPI0004C422B3|nr:hypothetical protein [Nocardia sp. NRRL WC-3656]